MRTSFGSGFYGGGPEAVGILGWYEVVLEIGFFFSFLFSLEYCTNWGVRADTCGTRVLTSSEVDSWRDAECWFFGKRERGETGERYLV